MLTLASDEGEGWEERKWRGMGTGRERLGPVKCSCTWPWPWPLYCYFPADPGRRWILRNRSQVFLFLLSANTAHHAWYNISPDEISHPFIQNWGTISWNWMPLLPAEYKFWAQTQKMYVLPIYQRVSRITAQSRQYTSGRHYHQQT